MTKSVVRTLLTVKGREQIILMAILFAISLLIPQLTTQYFTYIVLVFLTYMPILLGFNILFGYTGLLSFGHGLFVAIGMYTCAYLMKLYSLTSMEVLILTAMGISAIAGFGIGFLCVRYTRIFFALLTLSFSMIFYTFLVKFYYLTGGDEGIGIYLRPTLLGMSFNEPPLMVFLTKYFYYYVLAVVIIATLIIYRITTSHFGLCLKAIKENAVKAEALGLNVKRYRLYAFVLSAVFSALGGALLAQVLRHVVPAQTYWTASGEIVFMVLLGGFERFVGPILGGFVYIILRDFIMSISIYWRIIMGAALLVIIIFSPGGLIEAFRKVLGALKRPSTKRGESI